MNFRMGPAMRQSLSLPLPIVRTGFALWVTAALAGCAGGGLPGIGGGSGNAAPANGGETPAVATLPPLAVEPPAQPTAVVESTYTIDGAILPVVRGTVRQGTRADMRRSDSLLTFDNWLLRKVAGDGQHADIVRVDRKLVWTLRPAKQTYTECPITGCPGSDKAPASEESREAARPREPDCPVTVKVNELKVTSSGERKTINGFDTERFQLAWSLDIEDAQGRRNSNRLQMDLWTTPETGAVREVRSIDDAFQRRYAAALNTGDNPLGKYLPGNVLGAMSALTRNLDTRDARTQRLWAGEMRKVRGFPISMLMTWNSDGAVCGQAAAPAAASGGLPSLGGILGSLTGQKPAPNPGPAGAGTALISYAFEVKSLGVQRVGDSAFVPPPDYRRE